VFFLFFCLSDTKAQNFENSPFGFHPAHVNKPGYPDNGFIDAQNIGVKWQRGPAYVFWFLVQPDTNQSIYDFTMYDNIFNSIPEGINTLSNIGPQGHIDEGYCLPNSHLPADSLKYVNFVKATVERYDGDTIDDMPELTNPIKYWQVGNEPPGGKSDFSRLQKMTYLAIKEACPDCQVLIGGVGGFPDNYISDFLSLYLPIIQDLNGEAIDIFDFHWYGTATGDYRLCGVVSDTIKTKLEENEFNDIPVWITEMGSYSGDPDDTMFGPLPYQTEQQQAYDYLKRFVYPLSIGIEKIFPAFGIMEGFMYDDGYFDYTGLIYDGWGSYDLDLGVKKLGYYTYKLMTEKLEGSDWGNIQTVINGTDNVYAYKLTKVGGDSAVYVVWWDFFNDPSYTEGDNKLVYLPVGSVDSVLVTESVPDAENGSLLDENNYPDFFTKEIKQTSGDSIELILGENPFFVEEYFLLNSTVDETSFSKKTLLAQNFPNPFNSVTNINFTLSNAGKVKLTIYNSIGIQIAVLLDDKLSSGSYTVEFNADKLTTGVYIYRLSTEGMNHYKKCILIK